MSRLIRVLAERAGMEPDAYADSLHDQRAPEVQPDSEADWYSGPPVSSEPQKPAADKTSRHDRRRYDAMNRRIQVR